MSVNKVEELKGFQRGRCDKEMFLDAEVMRKKEK